MNTRSVSIRSITAAVLGAVTLAATAAPEPGAFEVNADGASVDLVVNEASSNEVLAELGRVFGFETAVTAADDRPVTLDLKGATVEEAVQNLSDNYSMVFARTPDGGYRVAKVASGGAGQDTSVDGADTLTVDDVIREVKNRNTDVKRYEAQIKMSMKMMGTEMDMDGKIFTSGDGKYRIEMNMPMMGNVRQITVTDGKTTETYMEHMNLVQVMDNERMREALGEGFGSMNTGGSVSGLDELKEDTVRYLGVEKLDGRPAWVLEGSTRIPETVQIPFMPRSQTVWIDRETGVMRRAVYRAASGDEMMRQELTAVNSEPQWEFDPFKLEVPEGVSRVDMTDNVIKMFQSMSGASEGATGGEDAAPGASEGATGGEDAAPGAPEGATGGEDAAPGASEGE